MSRRSVAVYSATAIGVIVVSIVAYLPHPGGIDQFLDLTVRYQIDRETFLSIWKQHPSLEWLRVLILVATVALSAALVFWPRRRDAVTLAAAIAAITLIEEIGQVHWYYLYASWFAPFVLIALLAPYSARDS
jgi:hypothetical protein